MSSQCPGCDRFADPSIRAGLLGDECVDIAVQQQDDLRLRQTARLCLVAQVDTCGDTAHIADLEIQDGDVRPVGRDRGRNVTAARDAEKDGVARLDGGAHLIKN